MGTHFGSVIHTLRVTRAWDGQCQSRKAWPATSVEIFVAEPKEDALGKAALSARLGVCLLIPYRDAPDKCSQNNTKQNQDGLLPKVRHH
jgi:hypothetical protein